MVGHLGFIFCTHLSYPMLTLNIYPTNAVSPIASVPQKVIRITAFLMFEPPVLAANAPKMIRRISRSRKVNTPCCQEEEIA